MIELQEPDILLVTEKTVEPDSASQHLKESIKTYLHTAKKLFPKCTDDMQKRIPLIYSKKRLEEMQESAELGDFYPFRYNNFLILNFL